MYKVDGQVCDLLKHLMCFILYYCMIYLTKFLLQLCDKIWFLQDMEVTYFQAYIDGVDFVFIESPKFRHIGDNIYGGNRTVRYFETSSN